METEGHRVTRCHPKEEINLCYIDQGPGQSSAFEVFTMSGILHLAFDL